MAERPDVGRHCVNLRSRELCATHRRHRASIVLRVRHAVGDDALRSTPGSRRPIAIAGRQVGAEWRALRRCRHDTLRKARSPPGRDRCGYPTRRRRLLRLRRWQRTAPARPRPDGCLPAALCCSRGGRASGGAGAAAMAASRRTVIGDAIHAAMLVVGDVERTVRPHRQSRRPMDGLTGFFTGPAKPSAKTA